METTNNETDSRATQRADLHDLIDDLPESGLEDARDLLENCMRFWIEQDALPYVAPPPVAKYQFVGIGRWERVEEGTA